MVRKLSSITPEMEEQYQRNTPPRLRQYSLKRLVIAARDENLTSLPGIGPKTAAKITASLQDAGFLLRESARSAHARNLLKALCLIPNYGTMTEYETRQELTDQQISCIHDVVRSLKPQQECVIMEHYGLNGDKPRPFRECTSPEAWARRSLVNAFYKLKRPPLRQKLLQAYFDQDLNGTSMPDDLPAKSPIELLSFSEEIYRTLKSNSIDTVQDLTDASEQFLREECHFDIDTLVYLNHKLFEHGFHLAMS